MLPYRNTCGEDAVQMYQAGGRTAMDWQRLLCADIMATNEDSLWTHTRYGIAVPRRNGKNEVILMRELWGLKKGEKIIHTAHRTSTSHSAWERLAALLADTGLTEGEDYKTLKQFGLEKISMKSGGEIHFRTRSSKGGLGEGCDLLVIDEAQEYTDDQEGALKYMVSSSKNPQTVLCGTPPTPASSGTVFMKLRDDVLSGRRQNAGWAEWSVENQAEPEKRENWYETNPSLGTILTERDIADEIGPDEIDFNIQRLGLWLRYNQKSAITEREWDALAVKQMPKLTGGLFVGIKFGKDGLNAAMSAAVRTAGRKIFIESLDCRPVRAGTDWIIRYLVALRPQKIVIDGAGSQDLLAAELKQEHIKGVVLPTVKEIVVANASFEQAMFAGDICHNNQPSLRQAASNCEKRAIGSGGGFGYKANKETVEIALLESAILAYWACSENKTRRKQKISY